LFPSQNSQDLLELFQTVAKCKKMTLTPEINQFIEKTMGAKPLTGSDVDSVITRAREIAVLNKRDTDIQVKDMEEAIGSFIDALDPALIQLQELAAVLACSDARYLPEKYKTADRTALTMEFNGLKSRLGG